MTKEFYDSYSQLEHFQHGGTAGLTLEFRLTDGGNTHAFNVSNSC